MDHLTILSEGKHWLGLPYSLTRQNTSGRRVMVSGVCTGGPGRLTVGSALWHRVGNCLLPGEPLVLCQLAHKKHSALTRVTWIRVLQASSRSLTVIKLYLKTFVVRYLQKDRSWAHDSYNEFPRPNIVCKSMERSEAHAKSPLLPRHYGIKVKQVWN